MKSVRSGANTHKKNQIPKTSSAFFLDQLAILEIEPKEVKSRSKLLLLENVLFGVDVLYAAAEGEFLKNC